MVYTVSMTEWKSHPTLADFELRADGQVRRNGKLVRATPVYNKKSGKPENAVVGVSVNGKWRTVRIHNLMLETFVGPRPDGSVACHGDGNPLNNDISNLRWASQKENIHDAIRHGTFVRAPGFKGQAGSGNHQAKLTEDDIRDIRSRSAGGESNKSISLVYNLHPAYVSLVVNRRRWGHID